MKPKLLLFYNTDCHHCMKMRPFMSELQQSLGIKLVNTYEDHLITENYNVDFVPTLVIEDQNGKHKFEGPNEIKKVLYELVSP